MRKDSSGFTLIEIVILIVLAGIVAGVLVPFLGTALTRSHEPLENLSRATGLSSQMAIIVAEYRKNDPPKDTYERMNAFGQWIESNFGNSIVAFKKFEAVGDDLIEQDCIDPENDPGCVLKVRIGGVENPGETLTYYFSYQ